MIILKIENFYAVSSYSLAKPFVMFKVHLAIGYNSIVTKEKRKLGESWRIAPCL